MVSILKLWVAAAGLFFQSSDSINLNDGPYVTYNEGTVEVRRIDEQNGIRKSIVQTFKEDEKKGQPLAITFSNHPEWNFSVPLRTTIEIEPAEFGQPENMMVLSDIEGEFEAFRTLLLVNNVIDTNYTWIFGKGHLVICGDLFDRGTEVAATLWLLYKLETDAKAKGGYVHTILGNHDIMNLSGDLRYVAPKYFENAKLMGVDYIDLYDKNTELGRWLRSKNLIEKIGDNLCMHAGMAPEINLLAMGVQEINTRCRPFYDLAKKPELFTDITVWKFFDGKKSSLFWYRGYFQEPKATEEEVAQTLSLYKVKRVIVGHTILSTNVGFYYNGKILGIAVNQHKGQHEGALFENAKWYKINITGTKDLLSF